MKPVRSPQETAPLSFRQPTNQNPGLSAEEVHELCHDVLNPIAAAYGYIQLLERTLRAKHHLETGERRSLVAIRSNLRFVTNLLQTAESDLSLEIHAILDLATAQLPPERRRDLTTHFEPREGSAARCNGHTMLRVVGNLLNNAAKYSPPQTPIEVTVELLGRWVEIAVSDHGIGIEPSVIEGIFNGRRTAGAIATAPGKGLGLRLSRRLLRAEGGDLWAESEPGRGSTFHARAPIIGSRIGAPRGTVRTD